MLRNKKHLDCEKRKFSIFNFQFSIIVAALSLLATSAHAQSLPAEWNTPGAGNPLLPGYFADPTIKKFGDTYYIYATTDGTGNGYGPAQVWMSKDFVNWRNVTMNWPTTEVVWACSNKQFPKSQWLNPIKVSFSLAKANCMQSKENHQ